MTDERVMAAVLPISELTNAAAAGRSDEVRKTPSPEFEAALRTHTDTGVVRTERTQIGGRAAADALRSAWQTVTGEAPSDDTLAVLTAHWAHETGNGKSMMNFNFAGLKGKGPSGLSVACSTREGYGENAVRIVDNFRAYRSAEEGATDYVSLLERRYPKAVEAARAGDASGFVSALKDRGYFTDNLDTYQARVSQLSKQARAFGFDAVGTAEASAAIPMERIFSETGGFRDPTAVPFDPSRMNFQAGAVDPYAFYDEITRASLRIGQSQDASDERDDEPRTRII
jgi:hypothetical protein